LQPLNYVNFIKQATERGFVSKHIADFPPRNDHWWSNDPETDPVLWAMRAVGERRLIYGAFFKGQKGFISPEWYRIYFYAFHPPKTVEERYKAGLLKPEEWSVWQLLTQENRPFGTHEIRKHLGVAPKKGAAAVDAAITRLQMTCDIIISGEADMLDKNGQPYNKSVAYSMRSEWIPDIDLHGHNYDSPSDALEKIYQKVYEISDYKNMEAIKNIFAEQTKLRRILC